LDEDIKKINTGQDKINKNKICLLSLFNFNWKENLSIKPKIETKPAKLISEVNCKALTDRANAFKNSPAPTKEFSIFHISLYT